VLLVTIGFILACITSAFCTIALIAQGYPDSLPVPTLLIPLLIAVFSVIAARTRIARFAAVVSGLVLLAFSVIAGFSIGMYYFPAAVVILAGAVFRIRVQEPLDEPEPPTPMSEKEFWNQR